ncbi:hypothetical protein BWQ96_03759 [Gracilariopsis chorda]|uniref:RING-type domain-containing protein n=1 Tax=Gracilariopsis chorda TaxID=448386 RepID=A0A2V3IWK2_9FLOR|nr:hypothetical protein BWQ96_03759 [Gracilariopsis chorda]|eukprot:PXF46524.1 hypothetical protein BWQ96_03759 [Gracilariopsis chorda]
MAPNRQQVAFEKPHFSPSRAALVAKAAALTFSLIVFTVIVVLYAYLFFQYDRSQLRHTLFTNPSPSSSIPITRPLDTHLPALTPTTAATSTFSHSDIKLVSEHWGASAPPHQQHTCAICLDDIKPHVQSSVLRLPCLHHFHQPCVTRWWKLSKPTCPCCNRNLTTDLIKLKNSLADVSPHATRHFDTQIDHSIRARRYVRAFGTLL